MPMGESVPCAHCGADNPRAQNYCGSCGARLSAGAASHGERVVPNLSSSPGRSIPSHNLELELARARRELEFERSRCTDLLNFVPAVVWEAWGHPVDPAQRIDFVSEHVEAMLGYSVNDWLTTPNFWLTIVHPEDREQAARVAAEDFVSGRGGSNRFRWIARDGHTIWVEARAAVIRDADDQPIGMRGVTMDVSERVRALEELNENERFLEALTSTMPCLLYVHDLETGSTVYLRGQVSGITGLPAAEVETRRESLLADLMAHDDPSHGARWRERLASSPDASVVESEFRFRHLNGDWCWLECWDTVFKRAPDGRPLQILGTARDVTKRKQAEEEARRREEQYKVLSELTSDFTFSVKIDENDHDIFEWITESFLEMVGYSLEELRQPGTWSRMLHPGDRPALEIIGRKLRNNQAGIYEHRFITRNGDVSICRMFAQPIWNESLGRVDRFIGAGEDITERRRAREALRASEERLSLAMESTQLGMFDYNPLTRNLDWSNRCREIYGVAERAPVDFDLFLSLLHPDDRPWVHERVQKSLDPAGDGSFDAEYRARVPDGDVRWIVAKGQAFFAEVNGKQQAVRFIGTTMDVTSNKKFEIELREARRQAEEANRAKDEFLATVSHELRTPLNVMLGWSGLLKSGKLDAAAVAHAAETIDRNVRLQTQIISDLLDVSRIITGKLRLNLATISPVTVVEAALETVQSVAEAKGVTVQVRNDLTREDGLPPAYISGDITRLQQVFWNLLSNAIRFTPPGGKVEARLQRGDGHVEIAVSDTGQGIAAEFLPFVFDRFRQADSSTTRQHGGLGLGLSIVRHIAEMHGGSVQVASDGEGCGATFTVRLPLAANSAPRESSQRVPRDNIEFLRLPAIETPADVTLSGIEVLIVDDEPDMLDVIANALRGYGADVRSAGSAAEAMKVFAQHQAGVIVSDIAMPGEDGYSLIEEIRALPRERGGDTPAIALTAYGRAEDRSRALEAGFQEHLTKPIEPTVLATTVARVLSGAGGSEQSTM